jgi:hypothetical protein
MVLYTICLAYLRVHFLGGRSYQLLDSLHNNECDYLKQGYPHQMTDELCLCSDCQTEATVDAMVDDTDYGSEGIVI